MTPKKLWLALATVIIGSFAVLGFYGVEIFREMPPFPNKVITEKGQTLFEGQKRWTECVAIDRWTNSG